MIVLYGLASFLAGAAAASIVLIALGGPFIERRWPPLLRHDAPRSGRPDNLKTRVHGERFNDA